MDGDKAADLNLATRVTIDPCRKPARGPLLFTFILRTARGKRNPMKLMIDQRWMRAARLRHGGETSEDRLALAGLMRLEPIEVGQL